MNMSKIGECNPNKGISQGPKGSSEIGAQKGWARGLTRGGASRPLGSPLVSA